MKSLFRKITRMWRRLGGWAPILFLLTIALGIAVLFKKGIVTRTVTNERKDLISSLSTIVTTTLIVIGSAFSYIKFFKGRMFSPKLTIEANSGAISYDGGYLHWVEVAMENKGSVPIWDYNVIINAILHDDLKRSREVTDFVSRPSKAKRRDNLIDIGETAYEHAFLVVPEDVRAVTFQIVITDETKTLWWRSLTVKNSETKDESRS